MALLDVITYGHPTLRKVAQPYEPGEITADFIRDMVETMRAKDGVGLAAPQVNVSKRFIVASDLENTYVLINPVIAAFSERLVRDKEGCLSIPGFQADVQRYEKVVVKAQNERGEQIELKADGLLARVLQHEIDHLNGVLYIDRSEPDTFVQLNIREDGEEEKVSASPEKLKRYFRSVNSGLEDLVFDPVEAVSL
jgi:peptide deformylase